MRFSSLSFVALICALAACTGHGKHTGKFKDEAQQNQAMMRAATDYDVAHQHYRAGELDSAREWIERSLNLHDGVPATHLLHSRILFELDRAEASLAAVDRGLEIAGQSAELHYHRGIVLERQSRLEDALLAFEAAAALEEQPVRSVLAQAEVLVDLGRTEEAQALLEGQPEIRRQEAGVCQMLGHIALLLGNTDQALGHFREAVLVEPDDPSLREDLARIQISMARFAEADSHLYWLSQHKAVRDRRDLRFLHACCLLELRQPVEARRILEGLTLGQGASDYDAWSKLGDAAVLLENDYLLGRAARRMINIDAQRPEGYLAQAWSFRRAGALEQALATLRQVPDAVRDQATIQRLRRALEEELAESGGA